MKPTITQRGPQNADKRCTVNEAIATGRCRCIGCHACFGDSRFPCAQGGITGEFCKWCTQ